jgi:hypothetical protein
VLDVLNNTRLEAAKRAAIITAALQWLLGRVPLSVVAASVPRQGLDRATAGALYWLRRRFCGVELGCNEIFR